MQVGEGKGGGEGGSLVCRCYIPAAGWWSRVPALSSTGPRPGLSRSRRMACVARVDKPQKIIEIQRSWNGQSDVGGVYTTNSACFAHRSLVTSHWSPVTAHRSLRTAHCALALCTAHCAPCTAHRTTLNWTPGNQTRHVRDRDRAAWEHNRPATAA